MGLVCMRSVQVFDPHDNIWIYVISYVRPVGRLSFVRPSRVAKVIYLHQKENAINAYLAFDPSILSY